MWTHPACDPDGDGHIGDCDSHPLKYRWQPRASLDLADAHPVPFNAVRHEVRAGEYSYVVLQTCLENAQNASLFEVVGGSMGEDERTRGARRRRRAPPPAAASSSRARCARPSSFATATTRCSPSRARDPACTTRAIHRPRVSAPAQFADALAKS